MPVSFKFVHNETGKAADLRDINKMASEMLNEPSSASGILDYMSMYGYCVLARTEGCEVTKEKFEKTVKILLGDFENQYRALLERFLYKEYTFHAWR